jgi:hypothetical protein
MQVAPGRACLVLDSPVAAPHKFESVRGKKVPFAIGEFLGLQALLPEMNKQDFSVTIKRGEKLHVLIHICHVEASPFGSSHGHKHVVHIIDLMHDLSKRKGNFLTIRDSPSCNGTAV